MIVLKPSTSISRVLLLLRPNVWSYKPHPDSVVILTKSVRPIQILLSPILVTTVINGWYLVFCLISLFIYTGCIKKLNRFEIALNFAKQLVVSRFCYI